MKRSEMDCRITGPWAHPGAARGNRPDAGFWGHQARENAQRAVADIARIDASEISGVQSEAVLRARHLVQAAIDELQKLFPRGA